MIAQRGKVIVTEVASSLPDDDNSGDPGANTGNQLSLVDHVKPADWLVGKNWGTLSIDASCTPAEIIYPTDLKILNEARESTYELLMISVNSHNLFIRIVQDMIVEWHELTS